MDLGRFGAGMKRKHIPSQRSTVFQKQRQVNYLPQNGMLKICEAKKWNLQLLSKRISIFRLFKIGK